MATAAPALPSADLAGPRSPSTALPADTLLPSSVGAMDPLNATRTDSPTQGRDTPPVPGAFIVPPAPAHLPGRPRSARASTFTSTSGSWHTALPDDLPDAHAADTNVHAHDGEADAMQQTEQQGLPRVSRMLAVFGRGRAGSRRRRALVSLIVASVEGSAQIIAIIVLLAYSGHTESPTRPGESEWNACERPLGVWNVIWLIRTVLMCFLAGWYWQIVKRVPDVTNRDAANDAENGQATQQPGTPGIPPTPRRQRSMASAIAPGATTPQGEGNGTRNRNRRIIKPPVYTRLSLLCSLLSLTWFITAHFLVYTSIKSCRHSAPHLWWLTFAILCITYLAILEAFLIGLVVLIIFPLLFLVLNIVLLCLGRHPIQNPLGQIKPTIGKLPKVTVDKLPLVMYIPAPPDEEAKNADGSVKPADTPTFPQSVHLYPPHPPKQPQLKKRFRFAFLRRRRSGQGASGQEKGKGAGGGQDAGEPRTWEENWIANGFPFVRLEGNRAACAICLMDFEEPPRAKGSRLPLSPAAEPQLPLAMGEAQQVRVEEGVAEEQLQLADVGEEAQPLRLLPCGHVFHRTCLDPWLTEVSGRCPTCQRPIELPDVGGKRRRWRQERRPEP